VQYRQGDYTVVSAAPLEVGRAGIATVDPPEPLRERFCRRRFTRQQLESWASSSVDPLLSSRLQKR